jgi:hypothetical protein
MMSTAVSSAVSVYHGAAAVKHSFVQCLPPAQLDVSKSHPMTSALRQVSEE